jgi:glucose-6-phosphate isomerase
MNLANDRSTPIDLEQISGLPIVVDPGSGQLSAGSEVALPAPGVRTIGDLIPVWTEPEHAAGREAELAYLTYRDVRLAGDGWLAEQGLRYDVTVTLSGALGGEFLKTAGHYHAPAPDGIADSEVYDVLYGRAVFLLQLVDDPESPGEQVRQVWIVRCEPGDRLVIPPNCGHVTVNVGNEPLAVANLVAKRSRNLYERFRELRGAAVYLLRDETGDGGMRVVPNPRYGDVPEPVVVHGSRCEPVLPDRPPVYQLGKTDPGAVAFLTRPSIATELFERL